MSDLKRTDSKIYKLIEEEQQRQRETLMMIPSENYASRAVMEATGSVLANKYSEGYPHARYYQGNDIIDQIEDIAIERAKELFDVPYVNVQPLSGSPMNSEVYFALLEPGDKIMGMKFADGGHLTHGHPKVTFSGRYFWSVQYTVGDDELINFEEVMEMAKKEQPKLIICGASAYPRLIDFAKFGEIADKVGAILVADISHIAGLVAGKLHPSPVKFAHVVTTTTHKTLRGPRGAMIMVTRKGLRKDSEMGNKISKAVFPGMQGGPHNNTTAAIAVCLGEASRAGFKAYVRKIVQNSNVLADALDTAGWRFVAGGTDTHLLLADMRPFEVIGKVAAVALEIAGMVANANAIPNDPAPPYRPSGLRFGTPALTTRGMGITQMRQIAEWMNQVLEAIRGRGEKVEGLYQLKQLRGIAGEVSKMARGFPMPGV